MALNPDAELAMHLFTVFYTQLTLEQPNRSALNESFFEFKKKLVRGPALCRIKEERSEGALDREYRSSSKMEAALHSIRSNLNLSSRQREKENSFRKKKKQSVKDYSTHK
jgi:hypothetical protein